MWASCKRRWGHPNCGLPYSDEQKGRSPSCCSGSTTFFPIQFASFIYLSSTKEKRGRQRLQNLYWNTIKKKKISFSQKSYNFRPIKRINRNIRPTYNYPRVETLMKHVFNSKNSVIYHCPLGKAGQSFISIIHEIIRSMCVCYEKKKTETGNGLHQSRLFHQPNVRIFIQSLLLHFFPNAHQSKAREEKE